MCPFSLTVHTNDPGLHLKPTSYVELNEIKKTLIKFLKTKGERIRVNNPSIYCFNYQDESGSIIFAENRVKIHSKIQHNLSLFLFLECI
jgi:hypothetical protein